MKIGFIGCGRMGSAIAGAVAGAVAGANNRQTAGNQSEKQIEIYISEHNRAKREEFAAGIGAEFMSNEGICENCGLIFFGVKPGALLPLLSELAPRLAKNPGAVVVSMAAGIALGQAEACLTPGTPVVRIMPNTPAAVGRGMIQYCANAAARERGLADFLRLMSAAGRLDEVDEAMIDAASAVSGCGPAFAYIFLEALADGGVLCGLPRGKALLYAAEMLRGAAEMALSAGKHPGELKDEVCSPGGSTIEGVLKLEEGGFRAAAQNAVIAAYRKTLAMRDAAGEARPAVAEKKPQA